MSVLSDFAEKIKDIGEDLVYLDVVTITGDLELVPEINEQSGGMKLGELYDKLVAKTVDPGSKMRVLAFTRKEPDLDAIMFVASNLTAQERELLNAHVETVRAAEQGRAEFLRMLREIFGV